MGPALDFVNNNLGKLGGLATLVFLIVVIYLIFESRMEQVIADKKRQRRTGFMKTLTGSTFEDQLVEALLMISSSLKAGRNLDQAFELVAISTAPPLKDEFQQLVQERRLGVPMVEALTNLVRRVPSQDLRLAMNATIFQQETGGNLEDLYRQIVSMVSERKKILGKVRAGCAHARLSGTMVGLVPIFFGIMMYYFQPDYLKPMLTNIWGTLALALSVIAAIIGLVFINKMTSSILPEAEESSLAHLDARRREQRWQVFRPVLRWLAAVNATVVGEIWDQYRAEIRYHLDVAGNPASLTPDEFIAVKELVALAMMCVVIIFLKPFSYGVMGIVLLVVLTGIGFHLPQVYLTRRTRIRQQNIEYELPYMIDLLSLAIEAGLDLVGGVQKIVEKSRPTDIVVEFQIFLSDLKLGKSLEESLSEMAERVQFLSFFAFVSSLIQAQRLGADIGPTLRAQAEQMRFQRLIQAEERMNRLPVLLLIPLVFFIFPSIFVLVMGPSFMKVVNEWSHVNPRVAEDRPAAGLLASPSRPIGGLGLRPGSGPATAGVVVVGAATASPSRVATAAAAADRPMVSGGQGSGTEGPTPGAPIGGESVGVSGAPLPATGIPLDRGTPSAPGARAAPPPASTSSPSASPALAPLSETGSH